MKKLLLIICIGLMTPYVMSAQTTIALDGNQSMFITGKGPGQDGAINPYSKSDSFGIVQNIGKNDFSIRIQKEGKIIREITVKLKETKKVKLLKGYEMYFDSELEAKVKVDFKEITD
jgi:hypothetical protein